MAQAETTTWDHVAQAFRLRGGGEQKITEAVDALRTTKLRPAFVLEEIETRFPETRAGNERS